MSESLGNQENRPSWICDDKTPCANCGHYEMNHANYVDWPRACNQTHCECREYVAPSEDKRAGE